MFDSLFESEDNDDILQLLFTCAHWHGLAKLHMHTDQTLGLLDEVTTLLGVKFRCFVKHTCTKFNTCELQHEANARIHRAAKKSVTSSSNQMQVVSTLPTLAAVQDVLPEHLTSLTPRTSLSTLEPVNAVSSNVSARVDVGSAASSAHASASHVGLDSVTTTVSSNVSARVDVGSAVSSAHASASHVGLDSVTTKRTKTFNLNTYKYHSLGDYVEHIQQYGTMDSYSTKHVHQT